MVNRILAGQAQICEVQYHGKFWSTHGIRFSWGFQSTSCTEALDYREIERQFFTLLGGRMFVLPVKRHLSLIQFDSAMYCFTALSSVKGFLGSSAEGMLMYWKIIETLCILHYSSIILQ